MKRKLHTLMILGILSVLMVGCSNHKQASSVLRVVTEQSTSDGMNYQTRQAAEAFEAEYEDWIVQIEVIPTDPSEREIYLQQLRTRIMSGDGPDIYLLPTGSSLTSDSPTEHSQENLLTEIAVEPLFPDVVQAMDNGVFADISSYYDADTDLNTAALNQDIMDSGVMDGRRYVLPLRYTMPLLLIDPEKELSPKLQEAGILALAEHAIKTNNAAMASGLRMPDDLTLLPQLFDYNAGEIRITPEEIADYMRVYQQCRALAVPFETRLFSTQMEEIELFLEAELPDWPHDDICASVGISVNLQYYNSVHWYGELGYHWSLEDFPLYADTLPRALEQEAISRVLGKDLQAVPMRTIDGKVTAEVAYYGAIGATCKDQALAYEFLRTFLTEEYQWDQVRPRTDRSKDDIWTGYARELQTDGMIEDSWPVRTAGATAYLWDTLQYQNYMQSHIYKNYHKLLKSKELKITDSDLPILQTEIDDVRFPFYQPYEETFSYALTLLNHEDGTPTNADIDKLAGQVYQYLWWHLAEG